MAISSIVKNCKYCGAEFSKKYKYSITQWHNQEFCSRKCGAMKRTMTDCEVVKLYKTGLSCAQIGDMIDICQPTISRIVRKYSATRTPSQRIKLSHSRPEIRAAISMGSRRLPCHEHVKEILRGLTGPKNHGWRGGVTITAQGYLCFTPSPFNGTAAGKCLHKVIVEKKYNRSLNKDEVTHHIDGDRLNNDPDNLIIMTRSAHTIYHFNEIRKRKQHELIK